MTLYSKDALIEECERYSSEVDSLRGELWFKRRSVREVIEFLDAVREEGMIAFGSYTKLRELLVELGER